MVKLNPFYLLEYVRNGLIEQFHTGFIKKLSFEGSFASLGEDFDYPFYLRSCAKPLQAAVLIDLGIDKKYKLTSQELAICCASHAGEDVHLEVLKSLMKKFDLSENMYKCGEHLPLSEKKQKDIIKGKDKLSVLHNNCSGKHTMMLAVCKEKGWNLENYYEINHPLQKIIKEKVYNLCEITSDFPISTDGCGVPIFSMPLKNILMGYKNLFFSEEYEKIRDAFLNNYYLIGGENRLDSAIISLNDSLIAKVGAGGLCVVLNIKKREGFIVKISDCSMNARAIVVIEALKQLEWIKVENGLLLQQEQKYISTLQGKIVGEARVCFDVSKF